MTNDSYNWHKHINSLEKEGRKQEVSQLKRRPPVSLWKQWSSQKQDKFFLHCIVLFLFGWGVLFLYSSIIKLAMSSVRFRQGIRFISNYPRIFSIVLVRYPVELLLKFLIGIINTELFKAVSVKGLKPVKKTKNKKKRENSVKISDGTWVKLSHRSQRTHRCPALQLKS